MWKVVGSLVLIGAVALAAPPRSPQATSWNAWAGAYEGSLTWSGCSVAGAKTVALPLDFVDGVASIDLAPTRPGMPSMTLVSDDRGYAGRQGDVAVALTRPKPDTLDLAIDLDSGCRVRGRLARASTGVAACNALVGWARIEARCTKLTAPPLEDLAKLVATRWKPIDAERCRQRAAKLEHALVDIGCAPHPDPQIGVRARACLELSQAADKLARCSIPPDIKDPFVAQARALAAAAQTADKATLPYVEQQCRDERAMMVAVGLPFHCAGI
jgi:hypothetical protein